MKTLVHFCLFICILFLPGYSGYCQPAGNPYSSDINLRLLEAASYGDYPTVVECLKKGADVNTENWDGVTALMYATAAGHQSIVKLLLEKGANVNRQPQNGLTALITASQYGFTEIAEMLIADSAQVDIGDNNKATALHYASLYNNDTIVFMLLKAGADPNSRTIDKLTPLSMAAINGSYEAAYLLIEEGAFLNAADRHGFTPLMLASQAGAISVAELLLNSGAHTNLQNDRGFSALSLAILNKHSDMVNLLLENGAKADESNSISLNPRVLARLSGDSAIIRDIRKAGAKPNFFPSFKTMGAGAELNFNSGDFISGAYISQHDFKYNLVYNFGFSFRPAAKTIYFNVPDYGEFQFRERRHMFFADLTKGFSFDKNRSAGIHIGPRLMYHFGHYRGTSIPVNGGFKIAPHAWFFVKKGNFEWRLGYHYSDYGENDLDKSRITVNFMYHFFHFNSRIINRSIRWID